MWNYGISKESGGFMNKQGGFVYKWGECKSCGGDILIPEGDVSSPYLCTWCSFLANGGDPGLFIKER